MRVLKEQGSLLGQDKKSLFRKVCFLLIFSLASIPARSMAQVIPDGSLPTTVEELQQIMRINGGEREGNNLFHSFEEFSVGEGIEAVFENGVDIENIFSRVTGDAASNINGILSTQGGANFFLVNPNGIVFGANAQLDVGGSFVATTADSIQFEDNIEFAANDSATQPIVSIERPIGLNFTGNSGAIVVNGAGHQIASDSVFSPIDTGNTSTGLAVTSDETLALIGGDINLSGAIISVDGGKVEIGSVNSGSVILQETDTELEFSYEDADNYQDISLSQQALLNASGEGQSEILLTGNNISFSDGSLILNQNRGSSNSGTIAIDSFESLSLSGISSNGEVSSSIRSESSGTGQAPRVDINTNQLQILEGALVRAGSYGVADGNDIAINASGFVEILDGNIASSTFGEGDAGNINLSTSHFRIISTGSLNSSTIGSGNGGEVNVTADLVEVSGGSLQANSNISASSFNAGNAGSVTVNTEQLKLQNGGTVSSSSFAEGNAGSLVINASKSVEVSGRNPNLGISNPESVIRTAVLATTPEEQRVLGLPSIPTGNSGDLTLETPDLRVFQQGLINVENQGTGDAGSLSINADRIDLDEAGNITAASISGTGGNIDLNLENLQLDDASAITATAGNDGDGGNISIKTTSLLAKKNSDITANAFAGTGGNVQIETEGLFLFPDSTIEASSDLGIDGTVTINTLDTNLQRDLEASEINLIVDDESLTKTCLVRRNENQGNFVVNYGTDLTALSGRKFFESDPITSVETDSIPSEKVGQLPVSEVKSNTSENVVPAQQAVKTEDGRVYLVSAPQPTKSLVCN